MGVVAVVMPCVVGVVVAGVLVMDTDVAVAQSIGDFRTPLRQPHFPVSLKSAAHERIESVLLAKQNHGQGNVNRR